MKVKKLEWKVQAHTNSAIAWVEDRDLTGVCFYQASVTDEPHDHVYARVARYGQSSEYFSEHATLEEAKAACQAHWNQLISECVESEG